jgi:hypothetical protein
MSTLRDLQKPSVSSISMIKESDDGELGVIASNHRRRGNLQKPAASSGTAKDIYPSSKGGEADCVDSVFAKSFGLTAKTRIPHSRETYITHNATRWTPDAFPGYLIAVREITVVAHLLTESEALRRFIGPNIHTSSLSRSVTV